MPSWKLLQHAYLFREQANNVTWSVIDWSVRPGPIRISLVDEYAGVKMKQKGRTWSSDTLSSSEDMDSHSIVSQGNFFLKKKKHCKFYEKKNNNKIKIDWRARQDASIWASSRSTTWPLWAFCAPMPAYPLSLRSKSAARVTCATTRPPRWPIKTGPTSSRPATCRCEWACLLIATRAFPSP